MSWTILELRSSFCCLKATLSSIYPTTMICVTPPTLNSNPLATALIRQKSLEIGHCPLDEKGDEKSA